MDWESNECLIDTCRLCLSHSGSYSIIEMNNITVDIFTCTGVEVSITDALPKKICDNCYEFIQKVIDFRILVSKNDLHLKSLFPDMQAEINKNLDNSTTSSTEDEAIEDKVDRNGNESNGLSDQKQTPTQTISIRKDLFPPLAQNTSNKINLSKNYEKINKLKTETAEVVEYKCGLCRKNFETWRKLYMHSRLHNRSYPCEMGKCKKMFSTKGDLDKHMRTHTGERPYECDLCHRKFTQKGTLKTHIETLHSDN